MKRLVVSVSLVAFLCVCFVPLLCSLFVRVWSQSPDVSCKFYVLPLSHVLCLVRVFQSPLMVHVSVAGKMLLDGKKYMIVSSQTVSSYVNEHLTHDLK